MYSFPWNAELLGQDEKTKYPILDRTFGADDFRLWIKALMTDGVYLADADAFNVTPSEGMKVLVSPGMCIINGSPATEPNTRELSLQASASQDRIDTIVIRWDNNRDVRKTDLYVKTGVASDVPVRPTLTRTETIYELGICDIYITANSTSVSADRITDTRLETERCGMVTAILEIDTTTFFNQLQAATDKAVELADSALDGTIAGNLQNQIDDKVSKEDLKDNIVAEGDSGIWHWIKYESGWAECCGVQEITTAVNTNINGNISGAKDRAPGFSLPFSFVSVKNKRIFVECANQVPAIWIGEASSYSIDETNTTSSYRIFSAYPYPSYKYHVYHQYGGYWK